MKRFSITVALCVSLAIAVIFALYAASDKETNLPQSFERIYKLDVCKLSAELDVKFNSYYIAGITNQHIYLGNITAPLHVLKLDYSFSDTTHIRLNIDNIKEQKLTSYARIKIDSPYFFLVDGALPVLLRGSISDWCVRPFMHDNAYFSQLVPIASNSFAIVTKSSKTREHVLGKITNGTPNVKLNYQLLEKQIDGLFCTDGLLNYDKNFQRLVFTYFYRNEFIVYDTNLDLQYRGHTLDTFSRAQIKIAKIESDRVTTLASSPKFINKRNSVSENYFYNKSEVLSKTDHIDALSKASIIDVYDLQNSNYKHSIYIDKYKDKNIREFQVIKNKVLVALCDGYIIKYDIKSPNEVAAQQAITNQ